MNYFFFLYVITPNRLRTVPIYNQVKFILSKAEATWWCFPSTASFFMAIVQWELFWTFSFSLKFIRFPVLIEFYVLALQFSRVYLTRNLLLAYQSFGVVYGDLSTSPLYVYSSAFAGKLQKYRTEEVVFGAFSLIFWTFTLIPLLKYVFIVLSADDNGEGMSWWIAELSSSFMWNLINHLRFFCAPSVLWFQEEPLLFTPCSVDMLSWVYFLINKQLMRSSQLTNMAHLLM